MLGDQDSIKIVFLHFQKKHQHLLFGLHSLFHFIHSIYLYSFLQISSFNKENLDLFHITIPSFISLSNQPYSFEEELKDTDLFIIDFSIHQDIFSIYENVFQISYSTRFLNQSYSRILHLELPLYQSFHSLFQHIPYLFLQTSFLPKNMDEYSTFIFHPNQQMYGKNPDHIYYEYECECENNVKNQPFYVYGEFLENATEIHLDAKNLEWIEYCMILNLHSISKKYIYVESEDEKKKIQKLHTKLISWIFLLK